MTDTSKTTTGRNARLTVEGGKGIEPIDHAPAGGGTISGTISATISTPARRVTPEMVDDEIADEEYYVFPGCTLTVCALTLRNGYTVTGESACADPANFNADLGRDLAKGKAREKIFSLLAYRLRDELHREETRRKLCMSILSESAAAQTDTLIRSMMQQADK